MVVIIDYGMGNVGSIKNMLKKVGADCIVSHDKNQIQKSSKLILPGVGSFDSAIRNLQKLDLINLLKEEASNGKHILGICLGMHLLTNGSDEGTKDGLGLVDAYVNKFDFKENQKKLPVPHMGWNKIKVQKKSSLFNEEDLSNELRFYFVHSYAVQCSNRNDVLTNTKYGYEFVSSFEKDNIIGVQFHPEKSHKFGMNLFKNFIEQY